MKKTKFLSLFLALAMLMVPSGKADVIKPAVKGRLANPRLYLHLKTGLERNIKLTLNDTTTPYTELKDSLLTLFGAYCLIVANHVHGSSIATNSVSVAGLERAIMPKGINRVSKLQSAIREKLAPRYRVPRACIMNWSYARYHYLCNPDLVYSRLPKKYRKESLELVRILSNFSVPPARPTVHRTYLTI